MKVESPHLPVSETVLLAWICGEESKFMEGLKMNQVNSKAIAFVIFIVIVVFVAGCGHVHNDSEEVPGRPNDPKTKELSLHLLVQHS